MMKQEAKIRVNEESTHSFEYTVFETVEEAIKELGNDEVLRYINNAHVTKIRNQAYRTAVAKAKK